MKFDMGGSAAVFGAAKALGQIKPPGVEVLHFSQLPSCMRSRGFTHISLSVKFLYDFPFSQVHFIVAACENMISGTGMRPGDIVTASNGKTIEVCFFQHIINDQNPSSHRP
jgi:leucyl aminopeptidase